MIKYNFTSYPKDNSDNEYWLLKTPDERIAAVESLRLQYRKMNPDGFKRFRRVYQIVKRRKR